MARFRDSIKTCVFIVFCALVEPSGCGFTPITLCGRKVGKPECYPGINLSPSQNVISLLAGKRDGAYFLSKRHFLY